MLPTLCYYYLLLGELLRVYSRTVGPVADRGVTDPRDFPSPLCGPASIWPGLHVAQGGRVHRPASVAGAAGPQFGPMGGQVPAFHIRDLSGVLGTHHSAGLLPWPHSPVSQQTFLAAWQRPSGVLHSVPRSQAPHAVPDTPSGPAALGPSCHGLGLQPLPGGRSSAPEAHVHGEGEPQVKSRLWPGAVLSEQRRPRPGVTCIPHACTLPRLLY